MRLMKMMNYDSKFANYWQHNVSEKLLINRAAGVWL
jgi:hypothetical protein